MLTGAQVRMKIVNTPDCPARRIRPSRSPTPCLPAAWEDRVAGHPADWGLSRPSQPLSAPLASAAADSAKAFLLAAKDACL